MDNGVDEKILDFLNETEIRKARKGIGSGPIKIGERYYEFEERTLMGTFSCRCDDYKEWRDIAFQVINNIKVIKENEGDEK